MPRIYLSPSTQEHNIGIIPNYIEEVEMNQIADLMVPLLKFNGFEVLRNKPTMNHIQCKDESNALKVDYHFALHSNAGGGEGTVAYITGLNEAGSRITKAIYKKVAAISPAADRGVRITTGLTEVIKTDAPAGLLEVAFHDDLEDAEWIRENHEEIAEAIVEGMCEGFGVTFKLLSAPRERAPEGYIFRVQCGAFSYKDNAQILLEKLKAKGFNSYIKLESR
jgi:N-acetylmuramoyl-L-alanine amidase